MWQKSLSDINMLIARQIVDEIGEKLDNGWQKFCSIIFFPDEVSVFRQENDANERLGL